SEMQRMIAEAVAAQLKRTPVEQPKVERPRIEQARVEQPQNEQQPPEREQQAQSHERQNRRIDEEESSVRTVNPQARNDTLEQLLAQVRDLQARINAELRVAYDAWGQGDYLCRNYVLNGLSNELYNVYSSVGSTKELSAALEKKYKTEDVGAKKFVVGKFLNFKMVDTKTVVSQVQEFQLILHDIHAEGMTLSESFQVAAVIEKLPPGWKDFKNYLKHKRKEMSLEDLVVRLCIEEKNRKSSGKSPIMEARANLLEQGSSIKMKPLNKGKQPAKVSKFTGTCYNCGKPNHMAKDCKRPKKAGPNKGQPSALVAEHGPVLGELTDFDMSVVVFEANLVDNPREWYIDTGATRHV
ncbi:Unknown protein, partial [Striga hermonthica]